MQRFTKWIAVFMAVTAASALICSVALAVPEDTKPVTLDLADVDVQAAIQSLFRGTGHNYSLSADVNGIIPSLSFKDVPFNVALKNLLKAANLVYRIQDGIYQISKKSEVTTTAEPVASTAAETAVDTTTTVETTIEKVSLQNANPREILALMKAAAIAWAAAWAAMAAAWAAMAAAWAVWAA